MSRTTIFRLGLFATTVFVLLWPLAGQESEPRKYALLVGVRKYDKNELKDLLYSENDVTALAKVFQDAGFKRVVLMTQTLGAEEPRYLPLASNIRKELKGILSIRKPGDTVVLAFAGHGVQYKGEEEPYFCPMDARLAERKTLLGLSEIYAELRSCNADVKLLLVDACRNDPQSPGARARAEFDLESVTRPQLKEAPKGVAAFFSCSKGQKAYESAALKHGVFFHYVLQGLRGKAADKMGVVTLKGLANYVENEVADRVQDEFGADVHQQPFSILEGGRVPLLTAGLMREIINSLKMKLVHIPPGTFTMGSPAGEEGRLSNEGPARTVQITKSFYMGSHEVTVGEFEAFTRGDTYQTEAEKDGEGGWGFNTETKWFEGRKPKYSWKNPGYAQDPSHPVVNVTWNDAVAFCRWLSRKEGHTYDLPTEAEWEYACRAETRTRFSCGDGDASLEGYCNRADLSFKAVVDADKIAKYDIAPWRDGHAFTAPVGSFKPNAWGLCDMHGNVIEWCKDWYKKDYYAEGPPRDPQGPDTGTSRVLRGGSFYFYARVCRAAFRYLSQPDYRNNDIGFRVVLRLP